MIPCVHRAHRGHQFLARRLLEQITESACLKSLENMFRGVIHREDQDTGVGTSLLYGACGIDAIEFGHGDVLHDNARPLAYDGLHEKPSSDRCKALAHDLSAPTMLLPQARDNAGVESDTIVHGG